MSALEELQVQGRQAAREAAPWVGRLARMGYAARGVVYVLVGGIAARAAWGAGERATGSEGAMVAILHQPFGRALLAGVALGLAGHALHRGVQAALDTEGRGGDAGGMLRRAGYALSGLVHTGLAWTAAGMALAGSGSDREDAGRRTETLLSQPFGEWLTVAVGLGFVGFGAYELYRAAASDPAKRMDLAGVGAGTRLWMVRAARAGLASRGVVFGLIGVFLVRAALHHDPGEARGLGGALRALQEREHGPWLLGATALGLVAYGVFELAKARYRRIGH
ncbi:MAG TPA: DUF1206 domain-containing protein [Longimicrobiaceae bacterium]|nr:DUF1206 domain-containing protein [Longimicrobiaceae bacterium]